MPPRLRRGGGRGVVGRFGGNQIARIGAAGLGRFLGRLAGRGVAAYGGPAGVAAAAGAAAADAIVRYWGAMQNDANLVDMYRGYGGDRPLITDYFPRNDAVVEVVERRGRDAGNPDPIADAQPNDAEYPAQPRPKRRKFARVSAFVHDNTQAKYIYDPTLPSTRFKRTKKGRYYTGRLRRSSFLSQRYF